MAGLFGALSPAAGLLGVPTPVQLYWDSVVRGKQGSISEKDFSDAELEAMRKLVAKGKNGAITYDDYKTMEQPGLLGLLSAGGRVANSLGQFNYESDPAGTTITDNYDFNPVYGTESSLGQAGAALGTQGFSLLHTIGEKLLPEGKGRKVKIRLPAQ